MDDEDHKPVNRITCKQCGSYFSVDLTVQLRNAVAELNEINRKLADLEKWLEREHRYQSNSVFEERAAATR